MATKIKFKRLNKDAVIPAFATRGSVGFDLCSISKLSLPYRRRQVVGTGLSCEIPKGYEMQIRPRSGLAAKYGITIVNSPGTVDSDYRGEIRIILYNGGSRTFLVFKGEKIAQGVVCKVPSIKIVEVDRLSNTNRGKGGFGSTGV